MESAAFLLLYYKMQLLKNDIFYTWKCTKKYNVMLFEHYSLGEVTFNPCCGNTCLYVFNMFCLFYLRIKYIYKAESEGRCHSSRQICSTRQEPDLIAHPHLINGGLLHSWLLLQNKNLFNQRNISVRLCVCVSLWDTNLFRSNKPNPLNSDCVCVWIQMKFTALCK